MMLNYYVFYDLGYKCDIMVGIKRSDRVIWSEIYKNSFSLDWSL